MPYVERGTDNVIKGLYGKPQPGIPEEFLPDSNAEVIAYSNPAWKQRINTFNADPVRQDILSRLQGATPAQIDNWVDTNATTLAGVQQILKAILKILATSTAR
jgi:hypothetical protein